MSMSLLAALLLLSYLAGPPTASSLTEQADRYAADKHFEKAAETWTEALKLDPNYGPALYNLGYYFYTLQNLSEAQRLLESSVQAQPDDFRSRYLLGATYSKAANVDAALRSWREALHLQPNNTRLMQIMAIEYSKGRYFGEASALAQTLLKQDNKDPNVYFLAIKTAQDAGDYDTAARVSQQAAQAFPTSARANFEHAFHLNLLGKTDEALQYLKKSMQQDPTYEEPFFLYGSLLVNQGHNAEAVPYLQTAIHDRNDFVPARVTLARALMNQKQWPEAIEELQKTIAIDPKHPQPHLLLSQIYFRLGEESKANEEKQLSLRLRRENPTVLEAVQSRPFEPQ